MDIYNTDMDICYTDSNMDNIISCNLLFMYLKYLPEGLYTVIFTRFEGDDRICVAE